MAVRRLLGIPWAWTKTIGPTRTSLCMPSWLVVAPVAIVTAVLPIGLLTGRVFGVVLRVPATPLLLLAVLLGQPAGIPTRTCAGIN